MINGRKRQMRRFIVILLVLFFATISVGAIFDSGADAQEKQNSVDSCVKNCHNTMGKDKFVHGPVAVGECTMCHVPTDEHKFALSENIGATCYKCHDKVDTTNGAHKFVKGGNCTECHDAHQSPNEFLLRTNKMVAGIYK
jgi:predicted CXXCH cytochrome family protein